MIIAEQNRLEGASREVRPSMKRMIKTLETEIRCVQRLIKEHINNHPDMKQQNDLTDNSRDRTEDSPVIIGRS